MAHRVSLLLAGSMSMLIGASFAWVGCAVLRLPGGNRMARSAHGAWWWALGAYLGLQGAFTLAAGLDRFDADLYLMSRALAIPLLITSVWGITSFMVYVYTGWERTFAVTAAFFAPVAILFFYVTFGLETSVEVQRWIVTLADDHPLYTVIYLVLGLPPILVAASYLLLLRKAQDRAQRYRMTMVAGSILLYVGTGLVTRLGNDDLLIFVSLVVLGGLAALASLLAYYPPPPIRRRLETSPESRLQLQQERERLRQRRLVELV